MIEKIDLKDDRIGSEDLRRLFFGAHVIAPWSHHFPPARLTPEETRHLTLAFLGECSFSRLNSLLSSAPLPSFPLTPTGIGKQLLFFPPEKSRVVSLSVQWIDPASWIEDYQKVLAEWLNTHQFSIDQRPFLPHITVGRSPFDKEQWQEQFTPLPFFIQGIHLYESLGDLNYRSLWEAPLLLAFEEREHTADIAFVIRGMTPQDLHAHAEIALAFKFPPLLEFLSFDRKDSLNRIIMALNALIGKADALYGCPFKAISFHGEIRKRHDSILEWEMIIDV